jgi:hypothetical protein
MSRSDLTYLIRIKISEKNNLTQSNRIRPDPPVQLQPLILIVSIASTETILYLTPMKSSFVETILSIHKFNEEQLSQFLADSIIMDRNATT